VREYASFSWPLFGAAFSRLLVVQGALLVANRKVGLAGIGAIGFATGIATFADRVDAIISQTIYPAVCAVADRTEALFEAFVKSNRVALMWSMPFGIGMGLFAHDFIEFVFGDRWLPAAGLVAAISVTCAFGQVAFNWGIFMRATNHTRPLFVSALADVVVFFVVSVPAIIAFGLPGYAAGFAAATVVQICLRGWFMGRLFSGFRVLRQLVRAITPAIPPALLILGIRAVAPGDRTTLRVIAEVALYGVAALACTLLFEKRLVRELVGYFRRPGRSQVATPA
jgi:lipopolysaccharide exporter